MSKSSSKLEINPELNLAVQNHSVSNSTLAALVNQGVDRFIEKNPAKAADRNQARTEYLNQLKPNPIVEAALANNLRAIRFFHEKGVKSDLLLSAIRNIAACSNKETVKIVFNLIFAKRTDRGAAAMQEMAMKIYIEIMAENKG